MNGQESVRTGSLLRGIAKRGVLTTLLCTAAIAQVKDTAPALSATPAISSQKYVTGPDGSILMNVNVWGHVNSPGRHLVYDGVDLATLLSVTGGPKQGANLRKVKLFRESEDQNGQQVLMIDLEKFLKTGNRSGFVKVLPNDTYIVPQTLASTLWGQLGSVSTILSLVSLYFQVMVWSGAAG